MCNFIVLKFNNTYSLICFRILCNSIYIEKAKRESNLPLFTCDYPDNSPLMRPLKGILSTTIVIFSHPKLLSFSVLTFIK